MLLAADAIDTLIASGHMLPGSRVNLARSGVAVAVAVPSGAPRPDISSESAVRAVRTLCYSTDPSGVALARLFDRWGLTDAVQTKLLVPPPGVCLWVRW